MRSKWGLWLMILMTLAACSLDAEDKSADKTPVPEATHETIPDTPVAMAATATITEEPTRESLVAPTVELSDTVAPTRIPSLSPSLSPPPPATETAEAVASLTPSMTSPPSLTPSFNQAALPDDGATSSAPPTSVGEAESTPVSTISGEVPTNEPTPAIIPTDVPTATWSAPTLARTFAPPPTFTPAVWPTLSPVPTSTGYVGPGPTQEQLVTGSAQVCATCGNLRLREAPGTAGGVLTYLDANTPVTIIGRTEDNVWVEVQLANGSSGWVAVQYLAIAVDLNLIAITGVAEDTAYPTAVAAVGPGGIEVASGISYTARQIFLDGRAKGNSAHTFTRVGDSITASPYFLTQFGTGAYELGEYNYLGGAINFFSGPNGRGVNPFGSASVAARNGWSTESVLDPALADRSVCRAGETPLECEYRVVKPAVALIMLGTNDSGGLPTAQYTANLNRIVQISIDMGVIPVLSTLPPKHYDARTDGRVAEFNQVIIATARAYDIPLWNYYGVMDPLPTDGLASDGVHPSIPPSGSSVIFDADHLQYGYTMRNLTALQVLYALWQQVLYDGDSAPPATAPAPVDKPPVGDTDPDDTGSPAPNPGDCTGTLSPRLTIGGQGRITPGLPNKMRLEPSLASTQVGSIPGEATFSVVGGPQCADGFLWWQVNYDGVTGWTANGDGTDYWVEPF